MQLSPDEVKYLIQVLNQASSYTIARGEQIDFPGTKHQKLLQKFKDEDLKLHP
jgi:hypothetical protein